MNFCDIRARVFLQSYVIMPGGRLPETENKRIYQISGPRSGCGRFGNLGSGRFIINTRDFLKQCLTEKQKDYL